MIYTEKLNAREMDGHTAKLWYFDSAQDFAEHAAAKRIHYFEDAVKGAEGKCPYARALSDTVRAMLADIDAAGLDVPHTTFQPDVVGAYPVVAEAIVGRPNCMRRRQAAYSSSQPIRLFVDPTGTANIGSEHRMRRGAVILALAMLLSRERPVMCASAITLGILRGADDRMKRNGNYGAVVINVPTNPLNESVAAFVLNPESMANACGFRWLEQSTGGNAIGWQFGQVPDTPMLKAQQERWERAALDMNPEDIYIPPAVAGDRIAHAPMEWLQDMLTQYRDFAGETLHA